MLPMASGADEPPGLGSLGKSDDAAEQADAADEAQGGMVASMDMPPHARAGQVGRGHRFAAYPRCSADSGRKLGAGG